MDPIVDKIKVERLIVYPIKSTHEIDVKESIVTHQGLMNDRILVVIRKSDNKFLTMRTHPALYEITTNFGNSKANLISIKVPNCDTVFEVNTSKEDIDESKVMDVKIQSLPARIYPVDILPLDEALSSYLKEPVFLALPYQDRLMKDYNFPKHYTKDFKETDSTHFADLAPILITSIESLEYINDIMAKKGEKPIDMICFRPNIVLSGIKKEFWEDDANRIKIGGIIFRRVKGCTRCKLTTYDIVEKKFRSSQEPLDILSKIRMDDSLDGVVFGQNYSVDLSENGNNSISLQDPVIILN